MSEESEVSGRSPEARGPEEPQAPVVSRGAGIRVRDVDLGARALIGSGAATEVHRLEAFTVPGHQGGVAVVSIRDQEATHWDSAVLSRLVALRWGLDARERSLLDGLAAWPLAVVEGEGGDVVGCLVPLAAHPFYYLPAEEKNPGKVPQQAKWLVVAPKRARRAGAAAVGERDVVARSTVLARVCLLMELLHRNGVVYGDLSDRSVLFGVGEVAEAFVVGCEGAVVGAGGDAVGAGAGAGAGEAADAAEEPRVLQRNSAGWAAPESFGGEGGEGDGSGGDGSGRDGGDPRVDPAMSREPSAQTVESDRYKLALLILRVLAPADKGLERSRDAGRIRGVLDETGQRMMHDALEGAPDARPSAADWYRYLRGVIVESLTAPSIRSVVVSPALVAEGDELRLEVELSGARQLTIEMPGRADITREVGGRIVSERFTARQSGRIRVRATNAHGEDVALTEQVRVLPVPSPARIAIATPEVPAGLGVLPDLASLEAALGISTPPQSAAAGGGASRGGAPGGSEQPGADTADGTASVSPFDRVAELRARLDADAMPLRDVLQIGLEAERVSRERDRLFPSFEQFLGDVTSRKGTKQREP